MQSGKMASETASLAHPKRVGFAVFRKSVMVTGLSGPVDWVTRRTLNKVASRNIHFNPSFCELYNGMENQQLELFIKERIGWIMRRRDIYMLCMYR